MPRSGRGGGDVMKRMIRTGSGGTVDAQEAHGIKSVYDF